MRNAIVDRNDKPIVAGDSVKIIEIPALLPQGLPEEDQIAIHTQLGEVLIVQGFSQSGDIELEFFDVAGHIHSIWIESHCLEKQ